jgi:hypothetical protein
LLVRGSPHQVGEYGTGLSLQDAESKVFRTRSDVDKPERLTAEEMTEGEKRDLIRAKIVLARQEYDEERARSRLLLN